MLDHQLQHAVDEFFKGWKRRVVERLEIGESRYHGAWEDMSPEQVMNEMMDEVLDMIAYAIFYRQKTWTPEADL